MTLQPLLNVLQPEIASLAQALEAGAAPLDWRLRRSARLPLLAALYQLLNQPLLLLTDRSDRALTLLDELALWLPAAPRLFFPEPNPLFYEAAPWGLTTRRDRLAVLTRLAAAHLPGAARPEPPPLIVAAVRAVMTRTLPRRDFLKVTRTLKLEQVVQPDELARSWVALGYEHVTTVITPGQFARRGGILDIWPPAEPQPTRIEFFGDEIDTLRSFDPATQRTVVGLERLQITPAREFIASPLDAERLPPEFQGNQPPHEFLIPLFHPYPASLLEYLPRQALVLLEDHAAARDAAAEIDEQAVSQRKEQIAEGALPADFPVPYLSWSELLDSLERYRVVNLGGLAENEGELVFLAPAQPRESPAALELASPAALFSPGPRFGGQLKPLLDHLTQLQRDCRPVIIVSRQVARLRELWRDQPGACQEAGQEAGVTFIEGSLAEGWTLQPALGGQPWHLLTDGEIFGWRRPEPRQRFRPQAEAPESAYADLEAGDWVVHVDYGIGRFTGLVQRTVEGIEREYLRLEYAEGDQLFVPVYQVNRLMRYVGPDGREPTPTRLGGVEWRNARSNVQEAVKEVASDLLDLYAQRQVVQGYAFSSDAPWQQELEASFPYIETEDQMRVLAEVKRDMENQRPMDRLVCGDVGYGKTEIALRAAFKAVMDGKQVAILVPTTVLAQQHYNTFRQRLAAFPVEVEMLSRFRTPQQQRHILDRLRQGALDIVIGTHRMIQEDVQFKNLGLLVIDEEQRFGVSHKETLKRMRTEVDVLTMTATPIPRTLYMALTGVRDISTINTPPEERLPVITHVGPYSPRLVRQAALRELERGGQVFFVHNRVQTINAMRSHLEKIVPEARLVVAHGQMPENELSERMQAFNDGEVDILLSTSIIESGLDIPNANTLIVDRADTFGLAQLYQLRGRVGRGAQRAYAYFFRHSRQQPTPEGRERLETIAENTQLGAGFSIAMRDLEIRGAGDILGARQHGHIAAVGFHLYTRLLADAVRKLRLQGVQPAPEPPVAAPPSSGGRLPFEQELRLAVTVDLPLAASIPAEYIADRQTRLRLYRRIADLSTLPEVDAMALECADRFGPLPEGVRLLLYQVKIKLLAERTGLASISSENGQVVLRYPPLPDEARQREFPFLGLDVRPGKNALWLQLAGQEDWQSRLLALLGELAGK